MVKANVNWDHDCKTQSNLHIDSLVVNDATIITICAFILAARMNGILNLTVENQICLYNEISFALTCPRARCQASIEVEYA